MADEQRQTLDQQTPVDLTGAAEDLTARVQELEEQLAAAQDRGGAWSRICKNVRRRAEQGCREGALVRAGEIRAATCWR
ncbi:hypothetical protein ACPA9J_21370 [Pseudomonas aeruginosa]